MGSPDYTKKRHFPPLQLVSFERVSMVCSLGGGQMTTLLEGGNTSQIMAENVGCWKLAAQCIQRELKEADEVNLLDEEDMHVFGLRPMMDPLILVCCNSCKKPVKVSQYAAHTEICKSLSSVIHTTKEAGQKKPPRKERKKLQNSISTQVGKPERSELANTATSNCHATSHPPIQAKGMSGVPPPLATKIFYSQRSQRLRSALSHMFYRSSSSTHDDHGLSNIQFSDTHKLPSCTSTHGYFHHTKTDDACEKLSNHVPCTVENCDPIPAKTSHHFQRSDPPVGNLPNDSL